MWKLALGFVIFAAVALFAIYKAGGNVDMSGEKHGADAVHAPEETMPKELESDPNLLRRNPTRGARPGGHFLSERPEKCAPMAGGAGVTSEPARLDEAHGGRRRRDSKTACLQSRHVQPHHL